MKKLISLLASIFLVGVSVSTVVSCGSGNKNSSGKADGDDSFYHEKFNYQTGPNKVEGANSSDGFITSFNVNAESTYSSYNAKDDPFKPVFNGNKSNFEKTRDDNFSLNSWLNDDIQFQNVLVLNKDLKGYSNINYSLVDDTEGIPDSAKLMGKVKFEKYILSHPWSTRGHKYPEGFQNLLSKDPQYTPDAIWDENLKEPFEQVKDSENGKQGSVGFDVWNALGIIKSPNNKDAVGTHEMKMSINYNYDGVKKTLIKKIPVTVKDYVFTTDIDNNDDTQNKFGLSTGTYPAASIKWFDGAEKGKVGIKSKYYDKNNNKVKPNISVTHLLSDKQHNKWYLKLNDNFNSKNKLADIAEDATDVVKVYSTYGSDLETTFNKSTNIATVTNNTMDIPCFALFEVRDKDKNILATYSVYFNEYGSPTIPSVFNKPDKKNMVDLLPPSERDKEHPDYDKWDVNKDGNYDKEDYDANGDGNPDEMGPAYNHGDYWEIGPKMWSEVSQLMEPMEQTNSSFIISSGVQKQLIQYTGRLTDDSYKNMKVDAPYQDYYEEALAKADPVDPADPARAKEANPEKFKQFITSTDSHKWDWSFDFSNLDLYMREAASKNIPEVMINPVDTGGFGFWYLKGKDATIGPERKMLTKARVPNYSTGKLTKVGTAFVDNVLPELVKALSKHLREDINGNKAFMTKDGKPVKIYFSFDENNEQLVKYVMKVVHENDGTNNLSDPENAGRIYSSAYLGWRSKIELAKNPKGINSKQFDDDVNDSAYDQIIVGVRNFASNEDIPAIADKFARGRSKGKKIFLYSTWDGYPGAYTQSDRSDSYWQLLFADRLGANGYVRWSYDRINEDYFDDSCTEKSNYPYVSGEEYLIYGGDDTNGARISSRLSAYANALNYVYKLKILMSKSPKNKELLQKALDAVALPANDAYFENNDYKWNVTTKVSSNYEKVEKEYEVPSSIQVFDVVKLIDSL